MSLTLALFLLAAPTAPAAPAAPAVPSAPVVDGAAIVARIEAHDVVELGHVGIDAHLGRGSVELIALETLGDAALPHLLALASSPSPVARVVGAAGLQERSEPVARAALAHLGDDTAAVVARYGCSREHRTVATAVEDLVRDRVLIRPARSRP